MSQNKVSIKDIIFGNAVIDQASLDSPESYLDVSAKVCPPCETRYVAQEPLDTLRRMGDLSWLYL